MESIRKNKRRIIAMTAGLLAAYITGCSMKEPDAVTRLETVEIRTDGEADTQQEQTENRPNSSREDWPVSWQAEYFSLENDYTKILSADQTLYGLFARDGQILLDKIKKETLTIEETFVLPDVSLQSGMAVDPEGALYFLEQGTEGTQLCRIDETKDARDMEKTALEDTAEAADLLLKGVETDASGYRYVWCQMILPETARIEGGESEVWYSADRVYVLNEQMETIFCEEIANISGVDTMCFQISAEGTPFFLLKEDREIYLQEIDADSQEEMARIKLGTALDCFGMEDANLPEHLVSTERGWLYCKNDNLFACNTDAGEKAQILNLSTYGILSRNMLFLAGKEDRIEIIDRNEESGTLEYIVFTPGGTDKKTLTLGVVMGLSDLERAVAEFNRISDEYRVEILDYYSREGTYEDAIEKLKLDVVTQKAPDIICVSGIDYQMFSEKGVLADLYSFMAEDEACSKDMLVQSVLEACEEQGHLYSIAPSFQLHSMWGYSDVIKGKSGVTFEELFEILQAGGKDLNAIGGFSADEPVLTRLCAVGMDTFVDWETGNCDFAGDYFKEVLSFAGNYRPNSWEGSYAGRIREREQVMSVGIISSVADYQLQKELYGGNLDFIGYPVTEGNGTVADFRSSPVAINAAKEDQAGAWAFVKFYLLQGYDGQGFPIVKEQFDQMMEAAMEDDFITAEDGSGKEKFPKANYSDTDGVICVYAATWEEVDAVVKLVEQSQNRFQSHPMIQNIIDEEAQAYFAGQVDLDRTVDKIQNRVSLLLQESR